jgi:hypothetical protein
MALLDESGSDPCQGLVRLFRARRTNSSKSLGVLFAAPAAGSADDSPAASSWRIDQRQPDLGDFLLAQGGAQDHPRRQALVAVVHDFDDLEGSGAEHVLRFGDDYRTYKQNVPRWIPRLSGWDRQPDRDFL